MKKIADKSVEFYFREYHVGTLFDKDKDGLYTYNSDKDGELNVQTKYFLPKTYEDEMMGSSNKKSEGFSFVTSICLRLNRPDLKEALEISANDSEFDMLFKLAQQGKFVGENFVFVAKGQSNEAEPCQPQ